MSREPLDPKILTVVYGITTIAYIALIGTMMVQKSGWWFLALFLWDWQWEKKRGSKRDDRLMDEV